MKTRTLPLHSLSQALVWSVLGAICYFLCFPNFDLYYASVLVLPCFLMAVGAIRTRREAVLCAALASVLMAVGGLRWIVNAGESILHFPTWVSVISFGFFGFIAAPQVYVFYLLGSRWFSRVQSLPLILQLLFWPSSYVAIEFLARGFKIFPEQLGNALVGCLPLAQAASLGGASLLSFIPLLLGTSIYLLIRHHKRAVPAFFVSLILPIGLYVWGSSEMNRLKGVSGDVLRVGLIQFGPKREMLPSILRGEAPADLDLLIRQYVELSKMAKKVDLLVWPESAYPLSFPARVPVTGNREIFYADLISKFVQQSETALLLGSFEEESKRHFNSGVLIGADGKAIGSYRKNMLLIFGERMPFASWFPSMDYLINEFGNFTPGEGPKTLSWPRAAGEVRLGVNICYEDIMPEYMRLLARDGAEIFVNLSNDDWSRSSVEQLQHFQLAILTAIENRRTMVRATRSGVTAVVSPSGEVVAQANIEQPAVFARDVVLSKETSFYTRFGDLFAWLTVAVMISSIFYFWRAE